MGEVRILLVDDDQDQSFILLQYLKRHRPDLAVSWAGNGEECLHMLKEGEYSAVILDHVLPDIVGVEVLARIKALGYTMPVVMVTGKGDEYIAAEAMRAGAYDYIVKDGNYFSNLPFALDRALERHELIVSARKVREDLAAEANRLREQLYQSDKMAAIGLLLAGVAHELNNPMTAILGYAQMLDMSDMDPALKNDVSKVIEAANRCKKIIQNLLSFARKHGSEKSPSDMNQALRDIIALRAYELRVNNILIEEMYSEDVPFVHMDSHQMQQVFLNLLINAEHAIQDSGRRGGRITVETYVMGEGDGSRVGIRFKDDGPGIKKEDEEKIFEPFYTTKGPGRGTGLGLSVCRGIVTEHGGDIRLEGGVGGDGQAGASFVLDIPVKPAQLRKTLEG